ncbi:hypothetical protein [Oceanobacillus jeddahense]
MMNQQQLPRWARDYLHYIQVSVKEPSLEYLTEIFQRASKSNSF